MKRLTVNTKLEGQKCNHNKHVYTPKTVYFIRDTHYVDRLVHKPTEL
jgi:hypothetical protein